MSRLTLATQFVMMAVVSGACSQEGMLTGAKEHSDIYEGLEELYQPLVKIDCTFSANTMSFSLGAGSVAVITKNADDNVLLNQYTCPSEGAGPFATLSTTDHIHIDRQAGLGTTTVLLDYSNGLFATGQSSGVGVELSDNFLSGDQLKIRGTDQNDQITLGDLGIAINSDNYLDVSVGSVDRFTISTGDGDDIVSGEGVLFGTGTMPFSMNLTIYGSNGDDNLTGGSAADTIYSGNGNDTLCGKSGDDTLYGEAGDDRFDEEDTDTGADNLVGGPGTDLVDYSQRTVALLVTMGDNAANDGIRSPAEKDNVRSSIENMLAGSGDDVITGNLSDNEITGGLGDDTLSGLAGNDIFHEGEASSGSDTFIGGAGTDLVDYSLRGDDDNGSNDAESLTITMGDGLANDGQDSNNDGISDEGDNVGSDIENIDCGKDKDTVTGNDLSNVIYGDADDDIINGGAGDDIIDGGTANSNNVIDCGAGQGDVGFNGIKSNCEL